MPEVTKVVEIVPYDEQWKVEFERIKEMLLNCIGDLVLSVEHIGSTSVEGLSAKPIIDIDVVIESYKVLAEIVKALDSEGFTHEGNLGIEGREAFKRRFKDDFMKYHLYVCPKDGKGYLEHIAFRDYLRSNPEAMNAYSCLKSELASLYRYDIESYCELKTEFVRNILLKTIYKA